MPDLEGRVFMRRKNALVPSDEFAEEYLHDIPEGKEVMVIVRRPRNIKRHKWFMALLGIVARNTERWPTPEHLREALKFDCGLYELREDLNGVIYRSAKSMNFSSMDDLEFNRFKNRCLFLLATKVLGCDPEELMRETAASQKKAA